MTTLFAAASGKAPPNGKRRVCFPITSRAYYGRSQLLLRKLQQDTDFRFQEMQVRTPPPGGPPASAIRPPLPPVAANGATPVIPPVGPVASARRGDAFDPSMQPDAPGVPGSLAAPAPRLGLTRP